MVKLNIFFSRISVFFLSFVYILNLHAQDLYKGDSTNIKTTSENITSKKYISENIKYIAISSLPLIATGLIITNYKNEYRDLRYNLTPNFKNNTDNYLQYSPLAVMLGLKTLGVDSRSNWSSMLVSDALSVAIMSSAINLIKYTVSIKRPDGSSNNSFPSGHTATAFMAATMLNKEYGHKSPFISIGAYSVAAATGIMRILNNRHWISDVIAGAGIGIMSTELGYMLGDIIFKNKDLRSSKYKFEKSYKPSFLGINTGISLPLNSNNCSTIKLLSGSIISLEGAYFINPYLGFGLDLSAYNFSCVENTYSEDVNSFNALKAGTGIYLSYPISNRFSIGVRTLVSSIFNPVINLHNQKLSPQKNICYELGSMFTFRIHKNYSIRLFSSYNILPYKGININKKIKSISFATSYLITF